MIKLSDYIFEYLVERQDVRQCFLVTGGGAMHLDDSIGKAKGLAYVCHHHEQAAAIAAEAYARTADKMAIVCVTSGPGATNAITGCLCAWEGSIPMIIISGNVRTALTVRAQNLPLRFNGTQEYDICRSVEAMTKYSVQISDPSTIRYHLEKACYLAKAGRPGPVWLDLPLDMQAAMINPDQQVAFDPAKEGYQAPLIAKADIKEIVERIKQAERPVLLCGWGVRAAGAYEHLTKLIDRLGIPVMTTYSTLDCISADHRYYSGRPGVIGDRAGNFAMQNSDLVLSIGSRLNYTLIGYETDNWAPNAYKIMVDIDESELKRGYLHIDRLIQADAGDFIQAMHVELEQHPLLEHTDWVEQCHKWTEQYPVVLDEYRTMPDGKGSLYLFYDELSRQLSDDAIVVTSAGTARTVGRQVLRLKGNQRMIANPNVAPMGYCLPAAIGASYADIGKPIICVTGEGGFQMNLQELQTIKHNNLPIHIFVINNEGYHSIRMTQKSFFKDHSFIGVGEDSGDLSFPDIRKIADAYGFPYFESKNQGDLQKCISASLSCASFSMTQIFVSPTQGVAPKVSAKQTEDGKFVSASLDDMAPFLSKEELANNRMK